MNPLPRPNVPEALEQARSYGIELGKTLLAMSKTQRLKVSKSEWRS